MRRIYFYLCTFCFLSFFSVAESKPIDRTLAEKIAANVAEKYSRGEIKFDGSEQLISNVREFYEDSIKTIYLVEYAGGSGFCGISADDRVVPILFFSFESGFDPGRPNPAFYAELDSYEKQIKIAIRNDVDPHPEVTKAWSEAIKPNKETKESPHTDVSPLLATTWNQGCYYNMYCPEDDDGPCDRVYAGCVAVSMAQVMKYYDFPPSGEGSSSFTHPDYGELSANYEQATYNWSSMPDRLNSQNSSLHRYVAELLYHCGVSVRMDYGPDASGSNLYYAAISMENYFKFKTNLEYVRKYNFTDAAWAAALRTELDNARPVVYRGSGSGGGHAFNCDGYQDDDYFHFNWGWGGYLDGYFYLNSLDPGNWDFNSNQGMIRYITPNDFTIEIANFTPSDICAGSEIEVDYEVGQDFNSGNSFTLQLSNPQGSFANASEVEDIGSLGATSDGTIYGEIPDDAEASDNYKLRIVSSSPERDGIATAATLSVGNPEVAHDPEIEVCEDEDYFTLSGGSPAGGTYSGAYVVNDYFLVNQAGVGTHPVTYTYEDALGCSNSAAFDVVVHPLPQVSFDQVEEVCVDFEPFLLEEGKPSGGTYSGPGVEGDYFDPGKAGVGTHEITYVYENQNGCENSASIDIRVNPLPDVNLDLAPEICENEAPIELSGDPSGGNYSGSGVIEGKFNPSAAGVGTHEITYAYVDDNGCENFAVSHITVNSAPELTFDQAPELCVDEEPIELTFGNPEGGTYFGPGVGAGVFDPSQAGSGNHSILYTYADDNGCETSAEFEIIVNPLPIVELDAPEVVCRDAEPIELFGEPEGGAFNGNGIAGKLFDPTEAGVGTHEITYDFIDENGCENFASATIEVVEKPTIEFESIGALCVGSDPIQIVAYPAGGEFSGEHVSVDGYFDPGEAGIGKFTATYGFEDDYGCSAVADLEIEVFDNPSAEIIAPTEICENDEPFELIANPSGGIFFGSGIEGNIFDPSTAGVGNRRISYEFEGERGCSGEESFDILVKAAPKVPEIAIEGERIFCTSGSFDSYEWLLNGEEISGGNGFEIYPESKGNYSLRVGSENGCFAESEEILFDISGAASDQVLGDFEIYPNPNRGIVTIVFRSDKYNTVDIFLTDLLGNRYLLEASSLVGVSNQVRIDLSDFARGVYVLEVRVAESVLTKLIVIE